MKKQNIFQAIFLLGILTVGVLLTMGIPSRVVSSITDYCFSPPYLVSSVPPNVLFVMDTSGSMNGQAYSSSFNPAQFKSGHYYGYFEPDKMYVYTTNNTWEETTDTGSSDPTKPVASGDFLNWATMRRIDVSKKLLIGGKATPRSPSAGITVKVYGEDSTSSWDFKKQLDNSSSPGLISPFSGDYYYEMKGNQLYVNPVHPGTHTFKTYPSGTLSAPAAWTVSGAPSAREAVDEATQDGDSTYIQNRTTTEPVILDYRYTDSKTDMIQSVDVYVVAKKSNTSNTVRLQGVLRVEGVDYPSNWENISTWYDTYIFSWPINPATGAQWQWHEIKATGGETLQGFGVQAYTLPTSSRYPRVTQVYLSITTSTPSGGPYKTIIDQGGKKAEGIIDRLSSSTRFGLAFYNYNEGGHIESYIDFGATSSMINAIHNVSPSNYTPLSETLYEMVRYFRQESPYYSSGDYNTGSSYDPYYYKYSKLAGSGLADQYVPCAKSFILMLTDGEPTYDSSIPSTYRDYDKDGKDPGSYPMGGTDYLDDVALWARTADHRAALSGSQNIFIYSVFMFGQGSQLLKDAAINGGFNDLNHDGKPGPGLDEYLRDSNGDGVLTSADLPRTYYEGDDGYELQYSITKAIEDISKQASSGTAVSVLTTSSKGVGSLVQAYFLPAKQDGTREVTWIGYAQNLWTDAKGNLREDTVNDFKLKLNEDRAMKLYFDPTDNTTKAGLFTTDDNGNGGTLASCSSPVIKPFSEITSLWEAGRKLAIKAPSTRTIFTSKNVFRGTSTTNTFSNNSFTVSNVAGSTTDCSGLSGEILTLCRSLDSDVTYGASNIVRYIRGECLETGVTGDTSCGSTAGATYRDRRVTVDGDLHVWKLGDIVNSTPKVFGNTPLNTYHVDYGDITYYEYIASDSYKKKSSFAFVGANDGMLHALRVGYLKDTGLSSGIKGLFKNSYGDSDDDKLGEEIWAYIPFNAFPYLKYLAYRDYCHLYYVDLSMRLIDVSIGGSAGATKTKDDWRTVLIGGMRFGGACSGSDALPSPPLSDVGFSSYFAIDVTNPESPVPLWEFSDPDMGFTTSYPSILRTGDKDKNGNWYVVLGSSSKVLPKGSTDIGRSTTGYVYILDLRTGMLVKKIALDHNAIVGDILAIDVDKDYYPEKIYFGTAYKPGATWMGKLISISIPNQDLSTWSPSSSDVKTLFAGNYPFTASPDVAKDRYGNTWVFLGSGKYYSNLDEIDTSSHIFFGLIDKGITIAEGDLYNATNILTTGNVSGTTQVCTYNSTSHNFGLETIVTSITPTSSVPTMDSDGWKVYLSGGERVISRPLAVGGLVDFLTFEPNENPCAFGGNSYLYSLGYTTGVAPSNVAILAPGATSAVSGNVTVYKGVLLGPGAPPAGEAIIIQPPAEGAEQLKKKIQIATGVIVEADNQPVFSVVSKIIHWLKK